MCFTERPAVFGEMFGTTQQNTVDQFIPDSCFMIPLEMILMTKGIEK